MRERKCIVSNEVLPETELIRFVADRDGNVLPDVAAKAPGRGVWVTAHREQVEAAIQRKGFARGFKTPVLPAKDLADQVEVQLRKRCLDLLGMGRRGGQVVSGYEKVRSHIRNQQPGWLIEAFESKADGRGKIVALCRAIWDDVPLVGCFSSLELGKALGRDHGTHVLMQSGALAVHMGLQLARLSGFTPVIPLHWGQKDG